MRAASSVLIVITHSTTMAVTTARNVRNDPAPVDAPARVRMRNQAEIKVAVAANEAAMTDSQESREYSHAVTRSPSTMARMRPTARIRSWWVGARLTCERKR